MNTARHKEMGTNNEGKHGAQAGAAGRTASGLVRAFVLFVSFAGMMFGTTNAHALVCTSAATGNWAAAATWAAPCNVATGPTAADTVTILNGHTVTAAVNAAATTLTINTGGTLTSARVITLSGATNITGTINLSGARANVFTGDVTLNSGAVWNNTTTSAQTFGGNFINNATTFTATGTGAYTFSGAGKTISGATVTSFPNLAITGTVANNATLTVTTALTGAGGLTNSATGILNIGGTSTITTLTATAVGNIVNYTGAAAQTVKATTYDTLNTSGAGVKSVAGIVTVNTALTGTALTNAAAGRLSIGGTSTITTLTATAVGNVVNYTGAAQTIKATSYATLNVTGTATNSGTVTVATALGGAGTLTNAATGILNIGGTSLITGFSVTTVGNTVNFTGAAAQTIRAATYDKLGTSGAGAKNIAAATAVIVNNTLTVNAVAGGVLTNNGTLTVTAALAGLGGLTNGATGTLNIGGTSAITTLTATAVGNVVNYTGAAQTIKATSYATLNVNGTASNTGTVTVATALGGTGTLTNAAAASILNIGGTSTIAGLTATFVGNTVNYTGAAAQTIYPTAYNKLGTSGAGVKTVAAAPAAAVTVGGTLVVTGGALTNNNTLTVTGVLSGAGTLTNATAASVLNLASSPTITTLTATVAGNTVNYTGAAQTVKRTTYNNLTLSGSLAKTITTASTIVNGVLSMEGTATASTVPTYGAAATLQYNTATARTAGAEWLTPFAATGGVIIANTGAITLNAAKVLNASVPLSVNTGATLNTLALALSVGGNITVNGAISGTTSVLTLSGAGTTIDGTGSITTTTGVLTITAAKSVLATANLTIASPIAITGAIVVTNNGVITSTSTTGITGSVAGSTWTNAANSTLSVSGPLLATGTLTATANPNTVNYAGAAQTVKAPSGAPATYYHLTFSGSGIKTMPATAMTVTGNFTMSGTATTTIAAALTVGGNFSVGAGNTFANGANALNVAGNFNEDGTFTAGTGVVTLNGGVAVQTISGAGTFTFANLTVSNAGITLARHVSVVSPTVGTITLTNTCPTDYTLTAGTTVYHSCPPPTPPANFNCVEAGAVAATGHLYTKLAGTSFSFDVVALKLDNTVETTYASASNKDVTVELVDGSGATVCASRTAISPAVSQTLTFTAADAGRKAAAAMTVGKAYADLRCRVTDATGAPTIVGCSTDNFSVRPGAATLTTTALAAAPSVTATPVIKSGTAFTIGATTSTGTTDAYTGTLTLDTAKLTAQLPSNGTTQQSGGTVGTLTMSPAVQANASPAQSYNATWNEVGYLYAAAGAFRDDSLTAVDLAAGDCVSSTVGDANLADTFDGSNKLGCSIGNKTAVSFGRFIPDHFDVAVNSNGTLAAVCASGGFTYTGLTMGYGTVPVLTIKPINAATGTVVTQNYQGVFQKLTAANVTITSPTADGTQNGLDGLTKTTLATVKSAGALTNSSGTLTYTLAAGDTYTYTRNANSLVNAYTSNVPLVVSAVGDGEVSAATLPTLNPTGVSIRFGRLKISNAHGSELLKLPLPIQTQYWNGTAFVTNTADNCTTLVTNNIKLTAPPTGVSATVGGAFSSGIGSLILSKPTTAARVAVDVCVDLGADPVGGTVCSATASANLPHLQGLWSPGTAYDNDPGARATFGVYKGNNEFIYLRESY